MRRSFIRYCLITALSAGTNFGLTIALHEIFGVAEEIAYGVALAVVFVVNFLFMRSYIFGASEGRVGRQITLYAFSAAGFRLSEYAAFLCLHSWIGLQYVLAMILIQTASFVFKFFYYGKIVFGRSVRPDTSSGEHSPTSELLNS